MLSDGDGEPEEGEEEEGSAPPMAVEFGVAPPVGVAGQPPQQDGRSASGAGGPGDDGPKQMRPPARSGDVHPSVVLPVVGSFTFYRDRSDFQATCFCEHHRGHCAKTRTTNARLSRPQQGRPLGFLLAWLFEAPEHENTRSRMDWDPCNGSGTNHDQRTVCRELTRLSHAEFEAFELCERPLREGEGQGPENCP